MGAGKGGTRTTGVGIAPTRFTGARARQTLEAARRTGLSQQVNAARRRQQTAARRAAQGQRQRNAG